MTINNIKITAFVLEIVYKGAPFTLTVSPIIPLYLSNGRHSKTILASAPVFKPKNRIGSTLLRFLKTGSEIIVKLRFSIDADEINKIIMISNDGYFGVEYHSSSINNHPLPKPLNSQLINCIDRAEILGYSVTATHVKSV